MQNIDTLGEDSTPPKAKSLKLTLILNIYSKFKFDIIDKQI